MTPKETEAARELSATRAGPFLVTMISRWDEDDRKTVHIRSAWGPRDARNLAEDLNPEYVGVKVEEMS